MSEENEDEKAAIEKVYEAFGVSAIRGDDPYASCDVTPLAFTQPVNSYWLWGVYQEIHEQWTSGKRIGTIYAYFDSHDVLHMHFAERGSYLEPKGALADIPKGRLPEFFMFPSANVSDSKANRAAELLSEVGSIDPNDPMWDEVIAAVEKRIDG